MNKRIELTEAKFETDNLILQSSSIISNINGLQAKGQMLVDSDKLSFVYLLETEDEFVYAGIPYSVWNELKEARDKGYRAMIRIEDQDIELVGLYDELNYLIENIKGNANYGEEMEKKVEELFS